MAYYHTSAYLPLQMPYTHQVFLSYATVDDYPEGSGWVAAFVSYLSASLSAAFGHRDPNRIWWDRSSINEEAALSEQIRAKVQSSACMVVILSTGYVKSKWCQQERHAFLEAVKGQAGADQRLFLIDIGNLRLEDRPPEFADKRGRIFYVQPPNTTEINDREKLGCPLPCPENRDHKAFFTQIDQLARDIRDRVAAIAPSQSLPNTPAPPQKPHADVTLYVCESADDCADEREEVVRFLSDYFTVLPPPDEPLPRRYSEWTSTLDDYLNRSSMVVEVLGTLPGQKIAGTDQRIVTAQHHTAFIRNKRILSWRKFPPISIDDASMQELAGSAKYAGTITDFMNEVKRLATPVEVKKSLERPTHANGTVPPMVFIQADMVDDSRAHWLSDLLAEMNCIVNTPLYSGAPQEIREDLEAQLSECDGLVFLYDQAQPGWVRSQFRTLPKTLLARYQMQPPRPLKALALCQNPSRPSLGVNAPGLTCIDLSQDSHRDTLAAWVGSLQGDRP